MQNKKLILVIVGIGIIFSFIGILLAMNSTGIFNIRLAMADMPFIGEQFKVQEEALVIEPLEEENEELREMIEDLKLKLDEENLSNINTNVEIDKYKEEIEKQKIKIKELEEKDLKIQTLSEYYSKMKANEAVPILENLDDDTVLRILIKLAPDKSAEFLTEMDPLRAAKLSGILTDKTNRLALKE